MAGSNGHPRSRAGDAQTPQLSPRFKTDFHQKSIRSKKNLHSACSKTESPHFPHHNRNNFVRQQATSTTKSPQLKAPSEVTKHPAGGAPTLAATPVPCCQLSTNVVEVRQEVQVRHDSDLEVLPPSQTPQTSVHPIQTQLRSISDYGEEQSTLDLPKVNATSPDPRLLTAPQVPRNQSEALQEGFCQFKSVVVEPVNGDAGVKMQTYKQILMQGRLSKNQQEPRHDQEPCLRYMEVPEKTPNQDGETLRPGTECIGDGKAWQLVQATSMPLDASPVTAAPPTTATYQAPDNDALLGQKYWQPGCPRCSCSRPEKRSEVTHCILAERRARFLSKMKGVCFNCLASDHQVVSCHNPTRCWVCRRPGHISTKCPSRQSNKPTYAKDGVASSVCCNHTCITSRAFAPSSSYPLGIPLLDSLLVELKHHINFRLEELLRPIKEEMSTLKKQMSVLRQESENLSMLKKADWENMVKERSSMVTSSCITEKDQERPQEQPKEIPMNTCTTHLHLDSQEDKVLIQAVAQVEDTFPAENTSNDKVVSNVQTTVESPVDGPIMPIYDTKIEEPHTCKDLLRTESFSSDFISTTIDHAIVPSPSPTTAAGRRRKAYGKSSYLHRARLARRNIVKDLGFLLENGQLNEGKIEEYADLLQEFLPLDLRLSLLKLEAHDFWEVLAKIIASLR